MLNLLSQALLITLLTATQGQSTSSSAIVDDGYQSTTFAELLNDTKNGSSRPQLTNLTVLENAYRNQVSNIQVLVSGRVISILSDDTNGDRHQRFIVRLSNSQTVLIAHNIDIAPRVSGLRVGDQVYAYGEYEWNSQGGVIHWTHHDPNRRHIDGWIQRNGVTFR